MDNFASEIKNVTHFSCDARTGGMQPAHPCSFEVDKVSHLGVGRGVLLRALALIFIVVCFSLGTGKPLRRSKNQFQIGSESYMHSIQTSHVFNLEVHKQAHCSIANRTQGIGN